MTRTELGEKLFFLVIAVLYSFVLSTRTIPDVTTENDTGRYVANLVAFETGSTSDGYKINEVVYYKLLTFFFGRDTVRLYFFFSALIVPIVAVFFIKWQQNDILIFIGLLLSMYYLELTTNALRECAGIALLLFAVKGRTLPTRLFFTGLSATIHYFAIIYLLYFIFFDGRVPFVLRRWLLVVGVLAAIALGGILASVLDFLSAIYSTRNRLVFDLFSVLPLIAISVIFRSESDKKRDWAQVSLQTYIFFVIGTVFVFFPAIMYRVTFSAFVALLVEKVGGRRQSVWRLSIFVIFAFLHLSTYLLISDNTQRMWT